MRRPPILASGLLSGALLGVASLPLPLGPLSLVCLVPLLACLARGCPLPRAAAAGFLAGALYFGIGYGWVPLAEAGGGLSLPLAYLLALPALASLLGAFAVGVAWLARRSPGLALLAAPGLWVALEYGRSQEWVFSVPWLQLGYALADRPALVQSASLFGLYGLSFWIVSVNAGLAAWPRLGRPLRGVLGAAALAPLLPALGWLSGPPGAPEWVRVAAVQPDVPEARRHRADDFHPNLGALLRLTEDAVAGAAVDVIVWPESAYERPFPPGGDAFLFAIANGLDAPLLTGVWRRAGPAPQPLRNAAVVVDRGRLRTVAEKVHPVPVFERAPGGPLGRALARAGLWPGRFEPGDGHAPMALEVSGRSVPVGVLVCVDAGYPELARRHRARGARLLVVISNEAGSGRWSALLHARVTRLRAIETGAPLVRVANTGPTEWVDARGRVTASLAPGRGAGVAALGLAGPAPLFVRLGDGPVVAAASALSLAAAGLPALGRRRRNPIPSKENDR